MDISSAAGIKGKKPFLPMRKVNGEFSLYPLKGAVMAGPQDADTKLQDVSLKKIENKSSSDITQEELEFIKAIDNYKRKFNKPFPTWREVLGILKQLGYRKVSN